MSNKMLEGKRGIVLGAINHRSVAYSVVKELISHGADVIASAQNDTICEKLDIPAVVCDVSDDASIAQFRDYVLKRFDTIDFIVHSVAFANMQYDSLTDVSYEDFMAAMNVSCFSFTALIKEFLPYTNTGGSYVTMSYIGSQKSVYGYNIMSVAKAALESSLMYLAMDCGAKGIRVNAISPGPLRTISGAGVSTGRAVYKYTYDSTPIQAPALQNEVAGVTAFLISNLSSAITAEVINVDSGFSSNAISKWDLER